MTARPPNTPPPDTARLETAPPDSVPPDSARPDAPDAPDSPHARDAETFLDAEVERTLAPYRGVLPAPALAELSALLRLALDSHPVLRELAARARPRAAKQASGTETVGGGEDAAPTDAVAAGGIKSPGGS
ncbi:MAG: hypothetical protein HY908_27190 [Myxococcales bacterium]|nr:hypothetical protein [Myxococcales bacterium]